YAKLTIAAALPAGANALKGAPGTETPTPSRGNVTWGESASVVSTVSMPCRIPRPVGVNTMVIVHMPPAVGTIAQSVVALKSPLATTPVTVRLLKDRLTRVTVCAPELLVCAWVGNTRAFPTFP